MQTSIIDIATLVTAIAGLGTAVVALWNIHELRLMRTVTSLPLLVTKDLTFAVACGENNVVFLSDGNPTVQLINFGNGPAVHAIATWLIADEDLIDLLRSYDPHDRYKVGFEKSPFADDPCLNLYWKHFVTRQLSERLNPLIPSPSGKSTQVKLPPYFLEAFYLYIALAVHARPEKKAYFPIRVFPAARLSVSYRDLANDEITVSYTVSLSYDHNATHQLTTGDAFACSLVVSQRS